MIGFDVDIWCYIVILLEIKVVGLKLDIKNFIDYVVMNIVVVNNEVDVNVF